jgi:hypothetical protein
MSILLFHPGNGEGVVLNVAKNISPKVSGFINSFIPKKRRSQSSISHNPAKAFLLIRRTQSFTEPVMRILIEVEMLKSHDIDTEA